MHQIRFQLGLRPRPRWGAHSAPPGPLLDLRGPTSKGKDGEGKGKEGKGREGKGEGEGGRKGEGKREGREGRKGLCLIVLSILATGRTGLQDYETNTIKTTLDINCNPRS